MQTYEIYTKGDDKVWLYTDDTFTLAISDCSDPEMATETTETTAAMLADVFSLESLNALLAKMQAEYAAGEISIHALMEASEGKLGKAIAIAEGEPKYVIESLIGGAWTDDAIGENEPRTRAECESDIAAFRAGDCGPDFVHGQYRVVRRET